MIHPPLRMRVRLALIVLATAPLTARAGGLALGIEPPTIALVGSDPRQQVVVSLEERDGSIRDQCHGCG